MVSAADEVALPSGWGRLDAIRVGAPCGRIGRARLPVPAIGSIGLRYGGFHGDTLGQYLLDHLPHSHVFCAYRRGAYSHSVLIYRLSGRHLTHVSYMDPDGGYHRWNTLDWFSSRGPMALMRK